MFEPNFRITPKIAQSLMKIEAAKQAIADLPMTAQAQIRLRETARLLSSHYSTQIEGNKLTLDEAARVIKKKSISPEENEMSKRYLGTIESWTNWRKSRERSDGKKSRKPRLKLSMLL